MAKANRKNIDTQDLSLVNLSPQELEKIIAQAEANALTTNDPRKKHVRIDIQPEQPNLEEGLSKLFNYHSGCEVYFKYNKELGYFHGKLRSISMTIPGYFTVELNDSKKSSGFRYDQLREMIILPKTSSRTPQPQS